MSLGVLRQRHSNSARIQSIGLICQKQKFDYETEAILALVLKDTEQTNIRLG